MAAAPTESLSRELTKWLQSLDLTYPVKHPRRDVSNGFTIAEIFCRYYPRDISMHSFDTGVSLKRKVSNWELLGKFFTKRDIPVPEELIEGVTHARSGVAVPLLEFCYTFLTQKELKRSSAAATAGPSTAAGVTSARPSFARPTASNLIKTTLRDGSLKINTDKEMAARKALDAIETVERDTRTIRSQRTRTLPHNSDATLRRRNETETLREASEDGGGGGGGGAGGPNGELGVQFEGVEIKQVERSAAAVRAAQAGIQFEGSDEYGVTSTGLNPSASLGDGLGDGSVMPGSSSPGASPLLAASRVMEPILALIEETVSETLGLRQLTKTSTPLSVFLAQAGSINADVQGQVFVEVLALLLESAGTIVRSSSDFQAVAEFLMAVAETSPHLGTCHHGVTLLIELGLALGSLDPGTTWRFFRDFTLPRVCRLAGREPLVRDAAAKIIAAYTDTESGDPILSNELLGLLRSSEGLGSGGGGGAYMALLNDLVLLEPALSDRVLAGYRAQAEAGLRERRHLPRLFALALLETVARSSPGLVAPLMVRNGAPLPALALDPSWQVQAQLLVVVSAVLEQTPAGTAAAEDAYAIIFTALTPLATQSIKMIGLSLLATLLRAHPGLCDTFLAALLSLPHSTRDRMLLPESMIVDFVVSGTVGIRDYVVETLPLRWDALGVAAALTDAVVDLPNLEREHTAVMAACLTGARRGALAEDIDQWTQLWLDLKELAYVALCDPSTCDLAAQALEGFCDALRNEVVATFHTLTGCIRLAFHAGGDPDVQANIASLLRRLLRKDETVAGAIADILLNLEDLGVSADLLDELVAEASDFYNH